MARLLICGGVAVARARLSRRVRAMADVDEVEAAATVADALSTLAVRRPDLILLDARLPGGGATAVLREVRVRRPRPVVLMLGGAEDADAVAAALVAGARGVLHRDFSHEELAATLAHVQGAARRVLSPPADGRPDPMSAVPAARPGYALGTREQHGGSGGARLGVPMQRIPLRAPAPGSPTLTERETQVLHGMAHGKSNAEIGRGLYLSEDTVKTHAQRLFRKLGVNDRAHAVAAGFRQGLVS